MKLPAALLLAAALIQSPALAAVYVKIPGVPGDVKTKGYDKGDWFTADSFSFGVEREMKESGEKGGTADINIGVGELQECTISKNWDRASTKLLQFAINGNSPGDAEIHFVELDDVTNTARPYLIVKLGRCFVKSWSTSGDADDRPTEDVAFYYNKIAFQYYHTVDGKTYVDGGTASWDAVLNKVWPDHGIPTRPPG